jgi:D-proline reductase (dithiol) PrdB
VFPIERMRELEAEGVIGELADPAYTCMGGIYSARRVRNELVPAVVDSVVRAGVDLFFLVPV